MHLSCLLIDTGRNPDRPRPGRLWLRNRYRVHQRLCMAFPTPQQRQNDREFLMPYEPCGFYDPPPQRCTIDTQGEAAPRQCAHAEVERPVHVPRDRKHNFLFRVEPQPGGRAVILVQSANEPDWGYAFHNARHILLCFDVRESSAAFTQGELLRFRIDANPTKRLREESRYANGNKVHDRWVRRRVPVHSDKLEDWIARRGERNGFRLCELRNVQPGYVYVNRAPKRGAGQRLRSARYDGILEVCDPETFRKTIIRGIGSAKAFGFGLLSVAPV